MANRVARSSRDDSAEEVEGTGVLLPPVGQDLDFRSMVLESSFKPSPVSGRYRRLVFNPMLGLVAAALWRLTLVWAWDWMERNEGAVAILPFLWLLPLGFALPPLFHYHCLDCGRTGRATRWRSHVCPKVARRIVSGVPARFRLPGPWVQGFLWAWILAGLLFAWS